MTNPEESAGILEQLEPHGRARVGRRLRHRILEHELSAPLPDRQAEDRPRLRREDLMTRAGRRIDRAGDHFARAQPAAQGRCGRRRDPRAARIRSNPWVATNTRAITSVRPAARRSFSELMVRTQQRRRSLLRGNRDRGRTASWRRTRLIIDRSRYRSTMAPAGFATARSRPPAAGRRRDSRLAACEQQKEHAALSPKPCCRRRRPAANGLLP